MSNEQLLRQRSDNHCELCSADNNLQPHVVGEAPAGIQDNGILLCAHCHEQLGAESLDENHWRCLNDSMWSQQPEVQVMAYRTLSQLVKQGAGWAQDLLDMLYLDDDTRQWAEAGIADDEQPITKDSNGTRLADGDSVTLIKDLVVKGANFTAKRGTMVKNISLTDNPEHIEGKVNGTQIVLVAAYLKKAN